MRNLTSKPKSDHSRLAEPGVGQLSAWASAEVGGLNEDDLNFVFESNEGRGVIHDNDRVGRSNANNVYFNILGFSSF